MLDERVQRLEEQAAAYEFLASVFTELPTEDMLESVLALDASVAGGQASEELARMQQQAQGRTLAEVLLDVARDRVVLVRGVYENDIKPPYEGLWTDADAPSSIAAVNHYYAAEGFEYTGDVKDAGDQLGVELSFVAALIARELAILAAGDVVTADEVAAAREQFLDEHPRRWVARYARAMYARASTGFYKVVARLLEELF